MPRVKTVPIVPLLLCTSLTPPNTPNGCGGKSDPDLAGGAWEFGVFALAFRGEELRGGKAKAKAPSREEGTASGARAGALVRGLREELREDLREGQHSTDSRHIIWSFLC